MAFNPRVFFRKTHRWGALLIAAPFLLVLVSGLLLQVKKQVAWVQPPTKKGKGKVPTVSMDAILTATKSVPAAQVSSWDDIDRLDLRLKDGIVKVQCKNRYEVQVDFQTGEVVQAEYRRSDFIETLHDGSWFGDAVKLYVFLPVAVVVLGLWFTGVYLFVLPYLVKWRRKKVPGATPVPAPLLTSPLVGEVAAEQDCGAGAASKPTRVGGEVNVTPHPNPPPQGGRE